MEEDPKARLLARAEPGGGACCRGDAACDAGPNRKCGPAAAGGGRGKQPGAEKEPGEKEEEEEHHDPEAPSCGKGGCASGGCGTKRKPLRYPLCLVWTPIPVITWLYPPVGHMGITTAAGIILDFAGPYYVNTDSFAFGAPTKLLPLDARHVAAPPLTDRDDGGGALHAAAAAGDGAAAAAAAAGPSDLAEITYDAYLRRGTHTFQHRPYNIFSENCHAYVAHCLNLMAYRGRRDWTMVGLAWLLFASGRFVSRGAAAATLGPFAGVAALGLYLGGWAFAYCWLAGAAALLAWFSLYAYVLAPPGKLYA